MEKMLLIRNFWKSIVRSIHSDPQTYYHQPEGPLEDYAAWLQTFDVIDSEDDIDDIMDNVPEMSFFYTSLVPKYSSHREFWQRFFYRVHQLKQIEYKRAVKLEANQFKLVSDMVFQDNHFGCDDSKKTNSCS